MDQRDIFQTGIDPIYPISVVSKILKIHPRTLLKYEKLNLLKPHRNPKNNRRLYTGNDIQWVACIIRLVHQDGYSLRSLSSVLALAPCWIVKGCPPEIRDNCNVFIHGDYPCWTKGKGNCSEVPCEQCFYFNHFHRLKEQHGVGNPKRLPGEGGWVSRVG